MEHVGKVPESNLAAPRYEIVIPFLRSVPKTQSKLGSYVLFYVFLIFLVSFDLMKVDSKKWTSEVQKWSLIVLVFPLNDHS
jgi:hypothetical protein